MPPLLSLKSSSSFPPSSPRTFVCLRCSDRGLAEFQPLDWISSRHCLEIDQNSSPVLPLFGILSINPTAIGAPWEGACSTLKSSRNNEISVSKNSRPCVVRCGVAEPSGKPAPFGEVTRYNDNLLDKAFMALFRGKMVKFTGKSTQLQGYEGFVDVSKKIMQGRTAVEQRAVVRNVLLSLLPPGAPAQFRMLFPPTKWSAEINAAITVPFFQWLVGPAELMEIEVNGVKQMSGVKITKCRYLESSGCVGMCVNMCKIPTQDFFTNEFGLPLTMTPNFEDMSCEMFYGQMPPPIPEDPALQQPCYASMCSIAPPKSTACPKLQQVAQDLSLSEVSS